METKDDPHLATAPTAPMRQKARDERETETRTRVLGPATATVRDASQDGDSTTARVLDDTLPDRVGPYLIEGRVGQGGMGDVLIAQDYKFNRKLALKRLHPFPTTTLKSELFISEMKVTASLDHPNIVPVIDRGTEEDGRPYFVMPLLRGRRLNEVISDDGDDRQSLTTLLDYVLKVISAVGHAHQRGVLHLDLKPANILCGTDDSVYVLDWGIARRLNESEPATGLGTPRYMAPEQADLTLGAVDVHTDIYGLGALLYSVATRRPPPYVAGGGTLLDDETSSVPLRLREIIARAMAYHPEGRYPSTQALAADLRDFFAAEPFVMVAYRDVYKGREAEYDVWSKQMVTCASRAPGHQSGTVIALPARPEDDTVRYLLISRFASRDHAEAFDKDPDRVRLVEEAKAFTKAVGRLDVRGRHAWLSLDGT